MLMAYPTMWLVIILTTAAAVQVELGTRNYHMANATPSQVAAPVPAPPAPRPPAPPVAAPVPARAPAQSFAVGDRVLFDGRHGVCADRPGALTGTPWFDGWNGCAAYGANAGWCTLYGGSDFNGEGSAQWACCACGGGVTQVSQPTPNPTPSPTSANTPSPTPEPTAGFETVTVGGGSYPSEVSWNLSCDDGTSVAGGAPYDQTISVSPGASCQLAMGDSWGDGWNGNSWEGLGQSFTLPSGSAGSASFTVAGATPGPTPAPTSSPTPPPTSSPTAGNSISARGDPHMTSVTGAKFDILRSGNHTLLHIPQHSLQKVALVFVRAFVKQEGATCLDMYIESLHITGKWAEERQRGGYSFFANQTSGVRKGWLSLGKLDFKVVYGTTVSGVRYLNLFARHLAKLGMPIGGILGLDGHESAATPEAGCQRRVSLLAFNGHDISSSSPVKQSGGQATWATF